VGGGGYNLAKFEMSTFVIYSFMPGLLVPIQDFNETSERGKKGLVVNWEKNMMVWSWIFSIYEQKHKLKMLLIHILYSSLGILEVKI
jgi:hypothetical protein